MRDLNASGQMPQQGAMPPEQGQPRGLGPQQPQAQQPGGQQATPEQQEAYNKFIAFCTLMLYDENFMPTAIEMIESAPTPEDGVAGVAATLAYRVYMGANSEGQTIPEEVVLHGGFEVVGEVAELAQMKGLAEAGPDFVEDAYYIAADMFRDRMDQSGMVDKDLGDKTFGELRSKVGDEAMLGILQRVEGIQAKRGNMTARAANAPPEDAERGMG